MGAVKSISDHSAHRHTEGQILQQPPEQQQPPYNGVPCEYHFIRIDIPFSIKINFLSDPEMQMAMADQNAYVPHLLEMYSQGYRLLSFQLTPGSVHSSGFISMTSTTMLRAQAIFRKNEPSENHETFSLQVVKSSIETGTFLTGVQSMMQRSTQTQTHTQHLYKMIHDHACEGCRLRCIEITGYYWAPHNHNPQSMGIDSGMAHGPNIGHSESSIYGVDLFFEIPQHQNPELYKYQAVPMKLNATFHATCCSQQWELQMDWQGVMNHHLGSGWRLVDVFDDKSVDTSHSAGCGGNFTSSLALNVIFIFEKPQSRLNDNTKVYEGTMIEYQAPWSASAGFNSSMVMDTNWDGAIGDMGQHGWELITILQTPATTTQTQFISVKMTSLLWMFFQRRVVDTSMPLPIEDPTGMEPPDPILPTGIN